MSNSTEERLGGPGSVCIYGGSFNPMHSAHIRVAVALREAAGMERVDIMPAATPPHKPNCHLLPMSLRMAMARAVEARLNAGVSGATPPYRVSDLEALRTGPSYTVDTLREYRRAEPNVRLFFCLGATDMIVLDTWHAWRELFELATFVVVTRGANDVQDVLEFMGRYPDLFPDASSEIRALSAGFGGEYPHSGPEYAHIHWRGGWAPFMTMPRQDVSGSMIRTLWRADRSLLGLMPECVEDVLLANAPAVDAAWGARDSAQG